MVSVRSVRKSHNCDISAIAAFDPCRLRKLAASLDSVGSVRLATCMYVLASQVEAAQKEIIGSESAK